MGDCPGWVHIGEKYRGAVLLCSETKIWNDSIECSKDHTYKQNRKLTEVHLLPQTRCQHVDV